MTMTDTELDSLLSNEAVTPSLADVERLAELWRQWRPADGSGSPGINLPNPERFAKSLIRLRLSSPPEGLVDEVAAVWRRHEESWAAQVLIKELKSELDRLLEPVTRGKEEFEQRSREVAILRLRCEALEQLAQVLDILSKETAKTNESDPGGEQ